MANKKITGGYMKRIALLMMTLVVILSACNMPASGETSPDIATAAALTVEAALNVTPLASPAFVEQSVNAETKPVNSQPLASFEDVTNCRTGPGVNYQRITQIPPLVSVDIIGFFPPNYWVVNTDAGPCWVAGEFVTPSGSMAAVPTVTAPPTPQGDGPQSVSIQKWNIACNYETNEADVSLAWQDKDGEDGYRIIRNGEVIAELSANSSQFGEVITLLAGQTVGYSIVAFSATGSEASKTITMSC
jgi:hypothetical protein